jgi:NADH-quinone oxidoreductase subunit H
MTPWVDAGVAIAVVGTSLLVGAYVAQVVDGLIGDFTAGRPVLWRRALAGPAQDAAMYALQQRTVTERPDYGGWALASALLAALAAGSVVVIPVAPHVAIADVPAGLVLFGAATALVVIAVFLHGWSANSVFPLIGAYRFVALALSIQIPFFLVLIAAALPAESLAVGDVVRAQASVWNVVRQPLGLPIYLMGGLGVAFWGPLAVSDAEDLAGGTLAEVSGLGRLLWKWGQACMLVAVAAMGASAFLGGWMGPLLPGPVWLALKTFLLLVVLVSTGHFFARVRLERFVVFAWTVLIPLSLVDVFLSGILVL